jgi:conjugal transfer mating pair stabilization protein TraG
MAQIPIIIFGGGEIFAHVISAATHAMNSQGTASYLLLIKLSALLAGAFVLIQAILKQDFILKLKWFGLYLFAFYLLFLPRFDLLIIDRFDNDQEYQVPNAPLGLSIIASYASLVGDALTNLIEKNFFDDNFPEELKYSKSGMLLAPQLISFLSKQNFSEASFKNNFSDFVTQCVLYSLPLEGEQAFSNLLNAEDLWRELSHYNSNTKSFSYDGRPTYCSEGINNFNGAWQGLINQEMIFQAVHNFPDLSSANAFKKLLQILPVSYSYLAGYSAPNAEIIFKQNLLINALYDSVKALTDQGGAKSAGASLGETLISWLPRINTILAAILVSSFLFVFLLLITPIGVQILRNYFFILLWVELWHPLFAIINYMLLYYARKYSLLALSNLHHLALGNISLLTRVNQEVITVGSYLVLAVPFFAWGIIKGASASATKIGKLFEKNTASEQAASSHTAGSGETNFSADFPYHLANAINNKNTEAMINLGDLKIIRKDSLALSSSNIETKNENLSFIESSNGVCSEQNTLLTEVMEKSSHPLILAAETQKKAARAESNEHKYNECEKILTNISQKDDFLSQELVPQFVDWLAKEPSFNSKGNIGKRAAEYVVNNEPELFFNYAKNFLAEKIEG